LLGDVFNAPVLIPNSLVEASNKEFAKETTGATGSTKSSSASRAALGAAYLARWGWRKSSRPDEKHPGFEDEVRWLMTKKSTVAGNGPVTSGGNRSRSVSAPGTAPGSGSYLSHHLHAKTGLAASSFAEEDEDEETYESSFGQYSGAVTPPRNAKALPPMSSMSSATSMGSVSGSSANLMQSGTASPNLPFDLDNGASGTHPPLAPIQPLPTEDVDIQLGLVKVAEPDHDTFLTYAAIVPEFCRLERMIVKGLV
jgi:xylulokinase